jgi:N-sulfoglucosamine sulfohydrolase
VIFYGGDHGMSFPFAKSNCYENSTRGALIVRWPGVIRPGSLDTEHMVTTLDFTPTLLDAAGLPAIPKIDGRSFLSVLKGRSLPGWGHVFTQYNAAYGNRWMPMRCVRTRERSYIWNAWSNGQGTYQAENMSGLSWKAMLQAAEENPSINDRTVFYSKRTPEEFYDLTKDPVERDNLIDDERYAVEVESMRRQLLGQMQQSSDPLAEAFAQRDDKALLEAAMDKLKQHFSKPKTEGMPVKSTE